MTLESPPPLLCAACRQPAPGGTLPGARCPADDALFIDAVDAVQRPDDPWLGQTIGGKYALFGIIGVGGFGAVYRAVQAPVGRIVAVKVIRPQLDASSQDTLRARFFREAKVVARLADPAIVTLYDYGEAPDGRLYMVFEYIDGTPLSAVLRSGPIEPARVAPLLHQILGALALAHRLGCVHRDLKPGNVMLTRSPFGEDIAKVLDFGIAKVTVSGEVEHSLQSSLETREGVVVGTPKYMAPEQARGLEIDGRADLYALGCLGYAMLTGRPPFDDASAVDVLMAQVSRSVPPFPEHLGVPAPLAAVLYRALSKSPNDRFATAEEMARALATFTPGLTGTRETVAATPSTPTNVSMPSATLVASPVRDADWPEAGTSREFASTIAPATSSPATSAPATSAPAATGTASAFDGRRGFFAAMAVGLVATVGWAALRPAPGPTEPDAAAPPLPQSPARGGGAHHRNHACCALANGARRGGPSGRHRRGQRSARGHPHGRAGRTRGDGRHHLAHRARTGSGAGAVAPGGREPPEVARPRVRERVADLRLDNRPTDVVGPNRPPNAPRHAAAKRPRPGNDAAAGGRIDACVPPRRAGILMPATRIALLFVGALWQTDAVPAAPMAGAQRAVDQASDHFRRGDFASALAALALAEPIALAANDPGLATIRFNIARCHEELGRPEDALAAYERYLGTPDDPHRKERAWNALRALEARVYGGLAIGCRPVDARIGIPGLVDPPRPCPLAADRVRPGRYELQVEAPGHLPMRRALEVAAGAPTPVEIVLVAETATVDAPSAAPKHDVWPWIALGTSVLAAGAGVGFTLSALDARDEAESLPPTTRRSDAVTRFERDETLSWVGYGLGSAALAAAVTLWLWPAPTPGGAAP